MATSPNFSWPEPDNTDLVKNGALAIRTAVNAIDSSMVDLKGGTTGQILAKATNTDMDFVWVANDVGDITGVTASSPLTGGGTSGAITVGIQDASTSQKGAVQLTDSTSTTSSTVAATATAVKSAYDLATTASTNVNNITMVQQYTATESVLKNIPSRIPVAEQLLKQAVYWIDAAQADNSDQVLDNQGWGAPALTTQLGSSASADSNDPKFLDFVGTNYVYTTGVNGNYLSIPDAAALDITGDIDIRVQVAMDDWTPAVETYHIGNGGNPGPAGYALSIKTTGNPTLYWYEGTTLRNQTSSVAPTITDGSVKWIRATLAVNNGASQYDVNFYTSDDGTSWTALGTTKTGSTGVTSISASSNAMGIGSIPTFSAAVLSGKLYRAQIFNGIDGTKVLDVDTSVIGSGSATSFDALTGQTVTINRSTTGKKSTVVTHPVWLFGTDDYMEVADNDLLDFAATDSFTLFVVQRQWNTFGTNDAILGKKADSTAATTGYLLGNDGTTAALGRMQSGDGSNGTSTVTGSSRTAGTLNTIAGVRNVSADNTIVYLNGIAGTAVTDTTTATLANAEVMRLGRLSDAGTEYNDMELVAAAIFRRVLTAAEITTLTNYYTARIGA